MTEAITPFNPKGGFGERHIHALPYRLMPRFVPVNEDHTRIGTLSRQVADEAGNIVARDEYLQNPNKALTARRTRLRKRLWSITAFKELNQICSAILGTATFGDEESLGRDGGFLP